MSKSNKSIQEIDFLPSRYRERSAMRRIKFWQFGVVCLYGLGIAAAVIGQRVVRANLQQQVDAIEFQYSVALANEKLLRDTQRVLNRKRATANLYAYLQHHWPRTQILHAITSIQPDSVSLNELHISRKKDGVDGRRSEQASQRQESKPGKKMAPPLIDLASLQRKRKERLTVWLSGTTADSAELHQFVADLTEPRILARADLISLDALDDPRRPGVFEFTVRVVVDACDPVAPADTQTAMDSSRTRSR